MNFEKLDVWKKSAQLSCELYQELQLLRDFGFRDQITRAGLSIPSNIADGMERGSSKEKLRFLRYAKGSCGELTTQLYIGIKIGYIEKFLGATWIDESKQIASMLVGLIKRIENDISSH